MTTAGSAPACISHPVYRQQRDQLVRDCVARFGTHPTVFAWDIHNEPSVGPDHPVTIRTPSPNIARI